MRRLAFLFLLCAGLLTVAAPVLAGGISADAGLTPADGRWIVRSQVRLMSREMPDGMPGMAMDRTVIPLVVVHGVTRGLTVGARQILDFRTMTMGGNETDRSGLGNLYTFAKVKAVRINTRDYTLGISPVLGVEWPTGAEEVSPGYTSLSVGLNVSGRTGFWALDLNLGYGLRGVAGVGDFAAEPGDETSVNAAFARQIPLGSGGETSLAPVLELTWISTAADEQDGAELAASGEDILFVAPGMKFTRGDLILETLVRIPVSQDQNGMQTEAKAMYLAGVRRMF